MAKAPVSEETLKEQFGPHLNYVPPGGWKDESIHPAEKLVKTHCCFCGQQCGIQLKVRDNRIIGFEPWEDFPFNRGMLCPKGVKRYMQSPVANAVIKIGESRSRAPRRASSGPKV